MTVDELELQLIAAMQASPDIYHQAMSLGADKILQTETAIYCLQQFDPVTGEFDDGALVASPEILQALIAVDVHGSIGTFKLRRLIQRVRAAYQQARMLRVAQQPGTPEEQINAMSSCVLELGSMADNGEAEQQEIDEALADIDARSTGKANKTTMDWSPVWLNALGGIGEQEFIVIGGRPGSGKSALMGQVCYELAQQGKRVMFITLEMSRNELRHRFAAYAAGFSVKRVDGLDPGRHTIYRNHFVNIANMSNMLLREYYSIGSIVSAISREALQGLDAVFVDYLQLITGKPTGSRLEQLSDITRQMKLTAKELRVPVFAGSQLNRASENKERPSLSDLRESGSIEQDADRVLLIHQTDECHEIVQAKCRNGSRHLLRTKFTGETTSFSPQH